jgi:hypothetical protein
MEVPGNIDSGETDEPAVTQELHSRVRNLRISRAGKRAALGGRYGKMPVRMLTPTIPQSYGAVARN